MVPEGADILVPNRPGEQSLGRCRETGPYRKGAGDAGPAADRRPRAIALPGPQSTDSRFLRAFRCPTPDPIDPDNLVTACWRNVRKSEFSLESLGWSVRSLEESDWRALTEHYPALWRLAERPNRSLHVGWMRALDIDPEAPG